MDFGFVPILVVIAVVAVRMSKEFKKVSRGRPSGGGVSSVPSADGSGSRDLFDFLEELRKQNQASPFVEPPPIDQVDPNVKLRAKIREAAKRKREADHATTFEVHEETPPKPMAVKGAPSKAGSEVDAFAVAKLESVAGDGTAPQSAGLAHDVFFVTQGDSRDMAKRAIVLREVLGPPLALR